MTKRTALATLALVVTGVLTEPAAAYYDDIHYALTYFVAREVGYTPEQAYRIASATVSVDWSRATEPVQGLIDVSGRAVAQLYPFTATWATRLAQIARWQFHAFRNEIEYPGEIGTTQNGIAADAAIVGQRTALWNRAVENPGVVLHFLQDEAPHAKYGSRGGHWPVLDPDLRDVDRHLAFQLPIGGSTDWLSFRSDDDNQALVLQTAALLTQFMTRVSPKQKPRELDRDATMALLKTLRVANPAPVPLRGQTIGLLRGARVAALAAENDAAAAFAASVSGIGLLDAQNVARHLNGPRLSFAIVAVDNALKHTAGTGVGDPDKPFGALPERFRQYSYDSAGELEPLDQRDAWVLSGTLKVVVPKSQRLLGKRNLRVTLRMAKTRLHDEEHVLDEAAIIPGGDPVEFKQIPIGGIIVELAADGKPLITHPHFFAREQRTITIGDISGIWGGNWFLEDASQLPYGQRGHSASLTLRLVAAETGRQLAGARDNLRCDGSEVFYAGELVWLPGDITVHTGLGPSVVACESGQSGAILDGSFEQDPASPRAQRSGHFRLIRSDDATASGSWGINNMNIQGFPAWKVGTK